MKRAIILATMMLISARAYAMEYSYRVVGPSSILVDASGEIRSDEDIILELGIPRYRTISLTILLTHLSLTHLEEAYWGLSN